MAKKYIPLSQKSWIYGKFYRPKRIEETKLPETLPEVLAIKRSRILLHMIPEPQTVIAHFAPATVCRTVIGSYEGK